MNGFLKIWLYCVPHLHFFWPGLFKQEKSLSSTLWRSQGKEDEKKETKTACIHFFVPCAFCVLCKVASTWVPGCAWPSSLPVSQPWAIDNKNSSLTGCCSLSRLLQQNIIDQAACKQQKFIPVDLKSKSQGLTIPVFDETPFLQMAVFLLQPPWAESGRGFLQGLYYKGPNQIVKPNLKYFNLLCPNASLPISWHWG